MTDDTLFPVPPISDRPKTDLGPKPRKKNDYVSSVWSFDDPRADSTYRWYGTLPDSLISRLLDLYSEPGSSFVDPFLGSGSSLKVALDHGLVARGLDVNPLACLVAEMRMAEPTSEISETSRLVKLGKSGQKRARDVEQLLLESEDYAYTRKWFREDTLRACARLLAGISELNLVGLQRMAFVALSQTVRDVASVDPRCTHHLVTKVKPFEDPIDKVMARINKWNSYVGGTAREAGGRAEVVQASALDPSSYPASVDFALLHPPYLGVINYHLIHRLQTDLLDAIQRVTQPASLSPYNFDYQSLRSADVSSDSEKVYSGFVEDLGPLMAKTISPGQRCALIIGDQRNKGLLRHPFTSFIESFETAGFKLEENFIWILQNNGGMHVLRRGHFIDHNYILVFVR